MPGEAIDSVSKAGSKTALILGYGAIGSALIHTLRSTDSPLSLVNAADPAVEAAFPVNVLLEPELIRNYNYVINTIPIHDPNQLVPLLIACLRHGVHYLDTNEDREVGKFIQLIGSSQDHIMFAPHCGLAPGLINVIGGHLLRTCDPVTIDLRVGALTRYVESDLLYTPTWSPEGIVNQYLSDFEVFEATGPVTYPSVFKRADSVPLGHFKKFVKQFYLDGIAYEAFPTSGGIGTMIDVHDHGKLKSIIYQTIRLENHSGKMMSMFNAFGFDRDKITAELGRYRAKDIDDYVLVIAKADNNFVLLKAESGDYAGRWMSAIQQCTAAGVAALLDMHVRGLIPPGFVHQHKIDWPEYSETPFIRKINFQGSRNGRA